MMTTMLAVSYGSVALALVAFAGGAVFSYLFLRANPNKKQELDKRVTQVKDKYDV